MIFRETNRNPHPHGRGRLGAAAPALAQSDETSTIVDSDHSTELADLKEWANGAIGHRLESIAEARAEVVAAEHITSNHESVLLADLAAAEANLNGLAKEVAEAQRAGEVWALLGRIASETRVCVVLIPKVIGVSVSDAAVVIADEVEAVGVEIQAGIDAAEAWGLDISAAQARLDKGLAQNTDARTLASPVAARMLDLEPVDFPATSVPVVEAAIKDLEASFALLESGGRDVFAAFEALLIAIGE